MRTLSSAWFVLVVAILIAGCTTDPPQRMTLEQKAFVAYGTFVVLEEQAVKVYLDESVSEDIKIRIQAADAIAKPSADAMLETAFALKSLRDAGVKSGPELNAATQALQKALTEALLNIARMRYLMDPERQDDYPIQP